MPEHWVPTDRASPDRKRKQKHWFGDELSYLFAVHAVPVLVAQIQGQATEVQKCVSMRWLGKTIAQQRISIDIGGAGKRQGKVAAREGTEKSEKPATGLYAQHDEAASRVAEFGVRALLNQ